MECSFLVFKMALEILKLCMKKATSEMSHVFMQLEVFYG